VAQQVVRMLNMAANPQARALWQDEADGKGDVTVWLATMLQKNLEARPSRESNVIEINFTGVDPGFSAAVANAFAQAYIDISVELRVDPARQYASWFDTQIKQQRELLENARRALSEYQQKVGLVATDERLDHEIQQLNTLAVQLTMTQAEKADSESRQRQMGGNTLPEVIQNPLVNQLKAESARLDARLQDLSGNLGENHPQYQRAQAEANELRSRLNIETARVNNSVQTALRVIQSRETELKRALEAQKQQVLQLRKQRDEANVLLREVETAQMAFDAVSQRLTQSKLEAQSSQTNISVLTTAVAPLKHSHPRILLNTAVAVFLGGLLALGTALALEFSQRRVRAAQDLLENLDLPLLAQLDSGGALRIRRRWLFWRNAGVKRLPGKVLSIGAKS
jgi:chain length determinant protein EpsF